MHRGILNHRVKEFQFLAYFSPTLIVLLQNLLDA